MSNVESAELPFREDWESGIDPERWLIFGEPEPVVYAGAGRDESNAVDPNGDDIFESGFIARQSFDITQGIRVQFWLRGHGEGKRKHSSIDISLNTCSPDDDAEQCEDPVIFAAASYATNHIVYGASEQRWDGPWDPLDDKWHQYSFTIMPNGLVRFFLDGQLKYTTEAPLDLTNYDPLWLQIRGRSLNSYYYLDDVAVWPIYDEESVTARYHFRDTFTSDAGFTSTHPD